MLSEEILGSFNNLTFQNHLSLQGPTLSFIDISQNFTCDNISVYFDNSLAEYCVKIAFISRSFVNFYSFQMVGLTSLGLMDIQFESNVVLKDFIIKNITFYGKINENFILLDSFSNALLSNFYLDEVFSKFLCLFLVINSQMTLQNTTFIKVKLSIDTEEITCILTIFSGIFIENLIAVEFNRIFIYVNYGDISLKNSVISKNTDTVYPSGMFWAYYTRSIFFENTLFSNLAYQSVIFK